MKRLAMLALLAAGCSGAPTSDKKADDDTIPGEKPVVVIQTSMGTIKAELYPGKSPVTVKNFLRYVDDKHYDGTVFHRVIPTFMIQGGGFTPKITDVTNPREVRAAEKEGRDPIKNEAKNGLSNKRGTLAMARTNEVDSATAQFFINVVDNNDPAGNNLDHVNNRQYGYAVFGKVIEGMDVVDKIKAVRTKALFPGFTDVPVESVVIESIRRDKPKEP